MDKLAPIINRELCEGCGSCAENCPAQILVKEEFKMTVSGTDQDCIYCGDCEATCRKGAIRCPISIKIK
jgi:NAD-dependent dihydropyrimidine dehydrogenase PreA subunit